MVVTARSEKEEIVSIVAEWAAREPLVIKAFLYGSWVKGTVHEGSDIDVAIVLRPTPGDFGDVPCQAWDKLELANRLEPLLPLPLHLKCHDPRVAPDIASYLEEASILVYDENDED